MLEVRDLFVTYRGKRGQKVHAVNGVSFDVGDGEILGLVGESGCGKSTLGRAIVGLVNPDSGTMKLDGRDLSGSGRRKMRGLYQMIFQDPYGSLDPRMTIYETLLETVDMNPSVSRSDRRQAVLDLLRKVGMDPAAADRYPHQFSGGQRQRIGIARALATSPKLIIADEPVSALDVSVQASVVNLLDDIRRETGTSFLFISHDMAVVEHISSRILVMYLGHIVESGPSAELIANPRHPYTKALISAVPRLEETSGERMVLEGDVPSPVKLPEGCPFHPRCPFATGRCHVDAPELHGTDGHLTACFLAH